MSPSTLAATAAWASRLPMASATSRGRVPSGDLTDGAVGEFQSKHEITP